MAIPTIAQVMHHTGNVQEDIAMGVRAEDFPFLADILNGLYSDTVAAPVREYSTNAWDSHVFAGVTRPIEITLPTTERLEFVVQDFGLGMSIDNLRETYAMYGASDKRDSNAVAGMLGLGSKSALSYAEAFTVSAVKGGVKVVAMVTKDDRGLGVIKVLDTLGTDEPNGVRITVPVDRYDVDRFRTAARNLFRFWEPGSVLVDGEAPVAQEWATSALQIDSDTWLVRKDAGLHSSYVIMGNVPYPVEDVTIGHMDYRFVARLNIGDVVPTPSREAVKNDRWTEETLSDLRDYITLRFKPALDRAKASTTTRWEDTLLRSVWMGSQTKLRASQDRPIWSFEPGAWGRKARSHLSYAIRSITLTNVVIVTGFTAKNLSGSARERLVAFAGAKANYVILPIGVGVGVLEGRPNTYTWDQIVGSTETPKADKAARAPKAETIYAVLGQTTGMTAAQLAEVSGTVLYLEPGEHSSHGDLNATVVRLYSPAQLPRIQRFVPRISPYQNEVTRQRKAAVAAITADDLRIMQAKTLPTFLTAFDPSQVHDLELSSLILRSKADEPACIAEAKRFGYAPEIKPLPDFSERYPLAFATPYDRSLAAERLFYMNARYDADMALAAQAVAS